VLRVHLVLAVAAAAAVALTQAAVGVAVVLDYLGKGHLALVALQA
jgi:hypothetical protein